MFKRVIMLALLLLLTICGQAMAQNLRIAISPSWPPLEFYDEQRKLNGFSVDYAHALARAIGTDYEIVSIARSEVFAKLQSKHVDIIVSSMSITPERAQMAAFSKSYLIAYQTLVTRAKDKALTLDKLDSKSIGAKNATTGFAIGKNRHAQMVGYTNISDAFRALAAGQIDGVICDSPVAHYFAHKVYHRQLLISDYIKHPEYYAVAVRRADPVLLDKVNQAINTLVQNGTYDKLVTKWICQH